MANYEGRLELTWTNKPLRLLAHEDGRYEWVPASDYRVAEVRLLGEVTTVGEVGRQRAHDNLLIRGDALNALRSLARLPEFAREYLGKVKLAYLDPPFNTRQSFLQYDDALEHSVWLTMMRDRLLQVGELLAADGSVWVHLDDSEVAYCRVLMDELFGRGNFVASVIWEKTDSPRMDADYFSGRHDTILVYRKSEAFRIRRLSDADGVPKHYNRTDEESRRYYTKPLRAMGGQGSTRKARPTLYYALTAPDGTQIYPKLPDGKDGAWRWKSSEVRARPAPDRVGKRPPWMGPLFPHIRQREHAAPTGDDLVPHGGWFHPNVRARDQGADRRHQLRHAQAGSAYRPNRCPWQRQGRHRPRLLRRFRHYRSSRPQDGPSMGRRRARARHHSELRSPAAAEGRRWRGPRRRHQADGLAGWRWLPSS